MWSFSGGGGRLLTPIGASRRLFPLHGDHPLQHHETEEDESDEDLRPPGVESFTGDEHLDEAVDEDADGGAEDEAVAPPPWMADSPYPAALSELSRAIAIAVADITGS